jgi:hypothetical protein
MLATAIEFFFAKIQLLKLSNHKLIMNREWGDLLNLSIPYLWKHNIFAIFQGTFP